MVPVYPDPISAKIPSDRGAESRYRSVNFQHDSGMPSEHVSCTFQHLPLKSFDVNL
jgi:hypothetical protein